MSARNHAAAPMTGDDYWMAVYRRRWYVLLITVVAGVVAGYASSGIEPVYEATAAFYVPADVNTPGLGAEVGAARLPTGAQDHAKAYVTLLQAADARRRIAEQFPTKTPSDLNLAVDFVTTREGVIRIFARDKDPELAARIANAFSDYFAEFHSNVVRSAIERSKEQLELELDETLRLRAETQSKRRNFLNENHMASAAVRIEQLETQGIRFDENLRLAEIDLAVADERVGVIEKRVSEEAESYQAGTVILESGLISALKERLGLLEVELAGSLTELREEHPQIVALRQRRAKAEEELSAEIKRIVDSDSKLSGSLYASLRAEVIQEVSARAGLAARVEGLREASASVSARVQELPPLMTELEALDAQLGRHETHLARLASWQDELWRRELWLPDAILTIEGAQTPVSPVYPIVPLNVLVAALGGLIAGLMYALFLDYLERRRVHERSRRLRVNEWATAMSRRLDALSEEVWSNEHPLL